MQEGRIAQDSHVLLPNADLVGAMSHTNTGAHTNIDDLATLIAKQIEINTASRLAPGQVKVVGGTKVDETTFESGQIAVYDGGEDGETFIEKRGNGYYGYNDRFDFEAKDKAELEQKLKRWGYTLQAGKLDEAKYHGKEVKLNKPMRSSGPKKYKVYTKNAKGNVIVVNFGDAKGGLTAKINNAKARKAFSDRHNCPTKKDKTKAGYWSCRLPRYASLLGLKSSFGGYW